MKSIFKSKLFYLPIFIILTAFSLKNAFKKAAGIVTAPVTFVSGMTLGKVVEGATSSTMDKYSSLIANYESANTNSINKLDTALEHRISQMDASLQNRVVQFDEVLKTSAKQIDLGVKDNIDKIDDVLKERIGGLNTGLTRTSFILTSGLWRIMKGTTQLIIFVIFIYFAFRIILNVNSTGNINEKEKKEIIKRAKPLVIISLVALVLISLFNPITNKYTNPDYEKLIDSYKHDLNIYASSYDYKKAAYVAYQLSELDYGNNYYKYLQAKYNLLKNLSYRSKYAIFNPQSRSELKLIYNDFLGFYDKSKKIDPEYSTINAIINQNFFNNSEGDILAALAAYNSLFVERDSIQMNNLLGTDVYAANIYKNFFFHIPANDEIQATIKQYGISISKNELNDFLNNKKNVDTLLYSSSLLAPNFHYNTLLSDLLRNDETNFVSYVDAEAENDTSKMRIIGNLMIDKWMNFTNEISNTYYDIDKIRFNSISVNDYLVQYIINSFEKNKIAFSQEFFKYSSDIKDAFKKSLNQANQNDTTNITIFKKAIGINLIIYFQEKPQLYILSQLALNNNSLASVSEFANSYIKMRQKQKEKIDETAFEIFEQCILDASKVGIYNYNQNANYPLTKSLISTMQAVMKPIEISNANKYDYSLLQKKVNDNLKNSYYYRIQLL